MSEPIEPTLAGEEFVVDGNAAAGLLQEIFGVDMTVTPAECAACGNVAELGGARAYIQAPGTVLRCPACSEILLRIVRTPHGTYLDARGVALLRIRPVPGGKG